MTDPVQILAELQRRIAYAEEKTNGNKAPKRQWDKYELLSLILDYKHEIAGQQANPHPQERPLLRIAHGRREVRIFFASFDLWVGFFWNANSRTLYCCPLPCCVIAIMPREIQ
jgi:hypothetical protein